MNTWQTNLIQNYLEVIDDSTYEKLSPSRRAMHPYEEALGRACLDHLALVRLDYVDLMRRCAPLSDRTKQILEINEEDHGKAIMVFTVVTVIFLPLSFVTSYFGMNASDIRDMDETQAVFWSVAIPLTCVTVGSCLLIGYNGDSIRDLLSSMYRKTMRKERDTVEAASITVAQRQGPSKSKGGLDSIIDPFGAAYEVFPSRRRDLYRASYGDDDFDEWYVPDHPMSKSPYLSQPYSSGVPAKGQHSYASPAPLAIEARRQSLYPYPHVPDRRSSRMDYKSSPYMPYKEAAPVRPRPHHIMKGHYANSNDLFNPFSPTSHVDPYADGDLRSRLNIYGHPMSHLPPYPPPRRMSTKDTTTRSRSRYYDDDGDGDDDDEWFERGGRVEVGSRYVRHGRSRSGSWSRSRSRSRSRDRFYERAPVRRVHYADEPVESVRHRIPSGDSFTYGADNVSGRPRRGRGEDHAGLEEEMERLREEAEREGKYLKRHRHR